MGSRSEASRLGALARLKTALLVSVAAVLGITVPVGGDALEVLVTPLVIVLVYSSLRSVEIEDLHAGTIGPAAVSLLLSYVALPAAAIVVGTALLSRSAFLGVLAMAVGPTTAGSALVWTRLSSGNVAVAGLVSVASVALAPLVTPALVAPSVGTRVSVAPLSILRELGIVVGTGAALAWVVPERIVYDRMDGVSLVAITVLVHVAVVTSAAGDPSLAAIVPVGAAALAITGFGFVLAFGAATAFDLSAGQRRALYFATSLKNLGIAIVVGSVLANRGGVGTAIVAYYVVQQLASGLVVGSLSPVSV